jgi:hypothetical protein
LRSSHRVTHPARWATNNKLYKNNALSDYDVVLIAEEQPEPAAGEETPDGARVLPAHGTVLVSKSEYFDVKIFTPLSQAAEEAPPAGKRRLFVQVGAPQLPLGVHG